jgi:hypothetical protein
MATTIFGVNEMSLRMLPMLFGVGSCGMCFLVFRKIQGPVLAAASSLLVASSSFYIGLSLDARTYSQFAFLSVCCIYFTIRRLEKDSWPNRAGSILTVLCLMFTHFYSVFFLAAVIIAVLWFYPRNKKTFTVLGSYALAAGGAVAVMAPFMIRKLLYESGGIKSELTARFLPGIPYCVVKTFAGSFVPKVKAVGSMPWPVTTALIPLGVFGSLAAVHFVRRFMARKISPAENLITAACVFTFALHAVLGAKIPTIHPRYTTHFMILAFGLLIGNLRGHAAVAWLAAGYILLINLAGLGNYCSSRIYFTPPWREVARTTGRLIESQQPTAVVADFCSAFPMAFYLHRNRQLIAIPADMNFAAPVPYSLIPAFGDTLLFPVVQNRYYAAPRNVSAEALMQEYQSGVFVLSGYYGTDWEKYIDEWKGECSVKQEAIYSTNQGPVSIYTWNRPDKTERRDL